MIARLGIEKGLIKWVTINDETPVEEFSDTEFVWEDKWKVSTSPLFGIEAKSTRAAKSSRINQVTYVVRPNGVAELRLRDEYSSRVLKVERVFATSGKLDGVLTLVYKQGTAHRFANFESQEFVSLRKEKGIDWVVKKDPEMLQIEGPAQSKSVNGFNIQLRARNISANVERIDGLSKFETLRRKFVTDGRIETRTDEDRTILSVRDASFVGIYKHRLLADKDQYVLVTADQTVLLNGNVPTKEQLRMNSNSQSPKMPSVIFRPTA